METFYIVYGIVFLIWIIMAMYAYRHDTNTRETPQWLLFLSCVFWPFSLLFVIISLLIDKPKKN